VLSGHSAILDPTVDAVRDDLADVDLADRVFAPHYARAIAYRVVAAATTHLKADRATAVIDTLVVDATLDVFDLSAGWAWVRTGKGMGYVPANCIEPA
jgi:hypothetical protein